MFQSFSATTRPDQGPPRLAALRRAVAAAGLDGFLVPRADAHQGEYVAPCDERLAWLTGFTGSAGFAAVLPDIAGLFVDGRYKVQARAQIDPGVFTAIDWPATTLADWLIAMCGRETAIGFDPWLHSVDEIDKLRRALQSAPVKLLESANLVDAIWTDRPKPPQGAVTPYPDAHAGLSHEEKRRQVAETLVRDRQDAAILTLPDSICWLLNIRGSDIPRIPITQGFAILYSDGEVDLFIDPAKAAGLGAHLGPRVRRHDPQAFAPALRGLTGKVRIDRDTAPMAVNLALAENGTHVVFGADPCRLPKACKNAAETRGAETAQLRDGAAMVEFLCWLDGEAARLVAGTRDAPLTEIDVVRELESFRRSTNRLMDISFETIAGAGPNGALPHYRVTEQSNRALAPGELFLVDSGGQYLDGTTDITRTVAIGAVGEEPRSCFTRVLKGMIAISRVRWPEGLAGRDLDPLARYALWLAGQDYDHGTGHGIGAYLSVHEGPQRMARTGTEVLRPGMMLSNEPGYYREGAFGIRIENLLLVETAPPLPGGDDRKMLRFRTLTYVPIDRRLILPDLLDADERAWLDAYHAETRARLSGLVSPPARDWLDRATASL